LGGVIDFPRNIRQNEAERHDSAESVLRPTRTMSDASLITWLDVKRLRDGDDDGDGGGAAA
jgi:hypothetical protein